jgi:hypothetical protein
LLFARSLQRKERETKILNRNRFQPSLALINPLIATNINTNQSDLQFSVLTDQIDTLQFELNQLQSNFLQKSKETKRLIFENSRMSVSDTLSKQHPLHKLMKTLMDDALIFQKKFVEKSESNKMLIDENQRYKSAIENKNDELKSLKLCLDRISIQFADFKRNSQSSHSVLESDHSACLPPKLLENKENRDPIKPGQEDHQQQITTLQQKKLRLLQTKEAVRRSKSLLTESRDCLEIHGSQQNLRKPEHLPQSIKDSSQKIRNWNTK